jgi:hypothetical protein
MNKQLQNKLKTYSVLTAAAGIAASTAEAAVIHNNVGYTGGYETYNLDIDGDGNNDFQISQTPFTGSYGVGCVPNGGRFNAFANGFLFAGANGFNQSSGALISSGAGGFYNNLYGAGAYLFSCNSSIYGTFANYFGPGLAGDKLFGVRFNIGADTHYGWVRVSISVDANYDISWTVVDMAYDDRPGACIVAGSTTGSDATAPTITGNAAPSTCPGENRTLSVSAGDLNNADDWTWYEGSLGGTVVGTGTSINVSPSATTDYVVVGTKCDAVYGPETMVTVTVINDVTAPVADAGTLTDVTSDCEVTSLSAPTATDNCAGSVTGTPDATFPITAQGTTVVTWTYDDGNGNTSTQTQNVTIDDAAAPVADAGTLADVESCDPINSVGDLTAPTATDNCAGSVTGTTGATFPITTSTTITWTYDDGNGNTSTQDQNIAIGDAIAPVADAGTLADVESCDPINSVGDLTAPTATDNCAGSVTGTTGATFPITTSTTITWTYDDGNGNTSTQDQNINITTLDAGVTQTGNTLTSDEATSGATYQWVDCDNGNAAIVGETNQSFTPSINGNYAVEVTNNGCSVTSSCTSVTLASTIEKNANSTKLHPNPASDLITIDLAELFPNTKMTVIDLTGKVVKEMDIISKRSIINLSDFTSGVYFVRISSEQSTTTVKFVKK